MSSTPHNDIKVTSTLELPSYRLAWRDLIEAGRDHQRWRRFAVLKLKSAYWRTRLGAIWLPLSFMLFIIGMSILWANITSRDINFYLPHAGYGFACFAFISGTIAGGEQVFAANSGVIREFPLPLSFYAYAKTARDFITMLLSLAVMVIIDVAYIHAINVNTLLALPALVVYMVTGVLTGLLMGMLATRFRDFGQLLPTVMRAVFFFTPIIWSVDKRPSRAALANINPLYHYIEIVRAPMRGELPSLTNWAVAIGTTSLIFVLVLTFYKIGTRRIRVWL
ncbi:MAG: ABC transporter permease [Pseudomonadota bacterium]